MSKLVWLIAGLLASSSVWAAEEENEEDNGLKHRVVELESLVATLQSQVSALQGQAHPRYTAGEAVADTTAARSSAIGAHTANTNAHHVQISDPDPTGVLALFRRDGSEIFLENANLNIRNGLNITQTTNGLGNLVVGYNRNSAALPRTRSHNVVIGIDHGCTSFGGLVVANSNQILAEFASISGGSGNIASGTGSSVSGGSGATADGLLEHPDTHTPWELLE